MLTNGQPLQCHAPGCTHRGMTGAELFTDEDANSGKAADGRGHALIGGKPWHFGCVTRAVRALLSGGDMRPSPVEIRPGDTFPLPVKGSPRGVSGEAERP